MKKLSIYIWYPWQTKLDPSRQPFTALFAKPWTGRSFFPCKFHSVRLWQCPHFEGLAGIYCLNETLPLNGIIVSSTLTCLFGTYWLFICSLNMFIIVLTLYRQSPACWTCWFGSLKCRYLIIWWNLSLLIVLEKNGVSRAISVDQYDRMSGFTVIPIKNVKPRKALVSGIEGHDQADLFCSGCSSICFLAYVSVWCMIYLSVLSVNMSLKKSIGSFSGPKIVWGPVFCLGVNKWGRPLSK